MVLLYMVCHGSHEYTPVMLAYIPEPWIRHGYGSALKCVLISVEKLPKLVKFLKKLRGKNHWTDEIFQLNLKGRLKESQLTM